jgi:beta-lactamase regulating signal transducer with metallopeptidase domain
VIALAMIYATAVGLVLGVAAMAAERGALAARRPARLVWGAVLLATAASALIGVRASAVAARPAVAVRGGGAGGEDAAAWEALLARAAAAGADGTVPGARVVTAPAAWAQVDRPLAWLWAAATLVLLLRRTGAARRLCRHAAAWPERVVGGTRVRVSPDAGPAVMGVLSPTVVLPAWAVDDPRLDLVLRHELAHVRAADPLLLAAAEALAVCMPWNPALWWQLGRLRAAVELDCDRRVLAGTDVAAYGGLLLDVAGRAVTPPALALALGGRRTILERRIRLMTDRRPLPRVRAAAGLLAALAGVAAAALVPQPALARNAPAPTFAIPPDTDPPRPRETVRAEVLTTPGPDSVRVARITRPDGSTRTVRLDRDQGKRPQPLYVVDGRVIPPAQGRTGPNGPPSPLPAADQIATVNVIKGEGAVRKYGAPGRNGVVEIVTKAAAPDPTLGTAAEVAGANARWTLDGQPSTEQAVKRIPPDSILTMNVERRGDGPAEVQVVTKRPRTP